MRYTHEVVVPVPAAQIDLPDWLFSLSEEDYARCQRGHRAIGVLGAERRSDMVNVESIGGSLLIQHYRTERADKHRVTMISDASRAYIMHLVPVACGVAWDMQITPSDGQSLFRCTIEVDLPRLVTALGVLSATPYFVRRHLVEETRGFADDMARKCGRP